MKINCWPIEIVIWDTATDTPRTTPDRSVFFVRINSFIFACFLRLQLINDAMYQFSQRDHITPELHVTLAIKTSPLKLLRQFIANAVTYFIAIQQARGSIDASLLK